MEEEKVYDRLSPEELRTAADTISGLIVDADIKDKTLRKNMMDFIFDAKENFVYRAEYPILLDQCSGCKHKQHLYWDNWTCDLGDAYIGCDKFEEIQ